MLNKQQLIDIKSLQDICEKEEEIQLKLNWEMLKARNGDKQTDLFHYEGSRLTGFLAIYQFGNKYEVCGMVNPKSRRKGIFTALFNDALQVIPENANVILINLPAKSQSAKHWLQTKTCEYSFSEYQMKWEPIPLELPEKLVQLRESTEADTETRIQLDITGFEFDEAEARDINQHQAKIDNRISYMIEVDQEPIGKIEVQRDEEESYICGFSVFPKLQGKGFGRSALIQTVLAENKSERTILLEVAAENKHALKLYEDCGFRSYEIQDYYQFNR